MNPRIRDLFTLVLLKPTRDPADYCCTHGKPGKPIHVWRFNDQIFPKDPAALPDSTGTIVSRKKILTSGASSLILFRVIGERARRMDVRPAPVSDPTLSARCDGSQLLLGFNPPVPFSRGVGQSGIPRQIRNHGQVPGIRHLELLLIETAFGVSPYRFLNIA